MSKDINEELVLKTVENNCGLKLDGLERRDDYVVARNIVYKLCYDNIFYTSDYQAHTRIGILTNRSRCMVRYALNNMEGFIESTKTYTALYNKCLFDLGLSDHVDKEDINISRAVLDIVKELKGLSDDDILEFIETRLKPFKKALESRVKPKVIVKVAGATLNR